MAIPSKSMDAILVKKLDNVLYALAIRTTANMVYTDDKYSVTLTELISDISDTLVSNSAKITIINEKLADLLADAPAEADTLKEIFDYINAQDKTNKEALMELIKNRVEKEEGKGLSTHDLTDLLYNKLLNDYTKEELDEKFSIIEARTASLEDLTSHANIAMSESEEAPATTRVGDIWYRVVSTDE